MAELSATVPMNTDIKTSTGRVKAKPAKSQKTKKTKKTSAETKRAKRYYTSERNKPDNPISVRVDDDLHQRLIECAELHKRCKSDIMRMSILAYVTRNGTYQIPESIGVVNDVYRPSVKEDVVELSNILQMLAFNIYNYTECIEPSRELTNLKEMLSDVKNKLDEIAGRVTRNSINVY